MKLRRHARRRGFNRIAALAIPGSRLSSLVFVVLAFSLFAFSSASPDNMQSVRTRTADIFAPALMTVNKPIQIAANYVSAISGLATLQEENTRLRQENGRLREWYQTALVLRAENDSLQKLLNITLEPQQSYVTARIISDSGNTYVRTQLVMAGRKTGVGKGQAVLAGEGLIGRIVEAGDNASRVLLMTDINSRIPVMVEGGQHHAILAGTNDDLPLLDHLPPGAKLEEGTRVITSGYGGIFPYGLPVGQVVRTPAGTWAVAPFSDPTRSIFVRIVNSREDPNLRAGGL